jgi:hypothetical protein
MLQFKNYLRVTDLKIIFSIQVHYFLTHSLLMFVELGFLIGVDFLNSSLDYRVIAMILICPGLLNSE